MLVGIDCRRIRYDGVGRFTQLLINALVKHAPSIDLVLFGQPEELINLGRGVRIVPYNDTVLSATDYNTFPDLVDHVGIDIFVATQYYSSPLIRCRQVRVLHDAFPMRGDFHGPTLSAFEKRFGMLQLEQLSSLLEIPIDDNFPTAAIRHMYELSVNAAWRIVTVSPHSREDLIKYFPQIAGKISVVPLHVSETLRCHCPAGHAPNRRRNELLHVSKWEPRKRQNELVRAVRSLRQKGHTVRLTMIGRPAPNFPEYGQYMTTMVTTGVQEGWVTWIPFASDEVLHYYYHWCSAHVTLSEEGFGLPTLEAMECGTPCIVPRAAALPWICGDSAWYVYSDLSNLEARILQIVTHDTPPHINLSNQTRSRNFSSMSTASTFLHTIGVNTSASNGPSRQT